MAICGGIRSTNNARSPNVEDLTGAFRRSNPTNGGNTKLRAQTEATMLNPASTAQQRLEAAKTYAYVLHARYSDTPLLSQSRF